ncbi:hypothetical protein A33M_3713 [Rhodovulum sp. PH10]|nr:hypothetical protein A33M_3713 [Rhodovulum sp. PH10]
MHTRAKCRVFRSVLRKSPKISAVIAGPVEGRDPAIHHIEQKNVFFDFDGCAGRSPRMTEACIRGDVCIPSRAGRGENRQAPRDQVAVPADGTVLSG